MAVSDSSVMQGPRGLFLVCGIVVLAAGAAAAQDAPKPKAHFLSPDDYAPDTLLPAPPKDGSPRALAELAEVRAIERERTPAQFARAHHDEVLEDAHIFDEVLGSGDVLTRLPATLKLLNDVQVEEKAAASAAKTHFLRTRPWIIDPALKVCAKDDPPQSSYPSGHATMAFSMAVILAQLSPQKAPAVMARAAEYADNRLVCGMHFRSDVVAGQALGTAMALKLMATPALRPEFEAAARELKAAGF